MLGQTSPMPRVKGLSIVHRPSTIIFMEGSVSKLHIKFHSFMNICLWKCRISPKYWVCHAAYSESCSFASKAGVDFAIHHSFKVICLTNWYRLLSSCVLRTLKYCMLKSAKNYDVSMVLSKCGFIGVAAFESTYFRIQKSAFLHAFASICKSYLQKCNSFKVWCRLNSLLGRNSALSNANVR